MVSELFDLFGLREDGKFECVQLLLIANFLNNDLLAGFKLAQEAEFSLVLGSISQILLIAIRLHRSGTLEVRQVIAD